MIKGPTTYSEWVNLLNQFANGDDSVLDQLNNGTFLIDAGTANRFYSKVEEVYKKRKQNWLDKFQRSFQLQNLKTENDFEIALRNGKQNLILLNHFISIKGLPEDLRKTLKKDLEDFITEIRTSLKKNNSNTSKNEKMLMLLNSFQFNTISAEIKSDQKNNSEITASTGRKIIF
ncbi:hypothetical protein DBB36_06160 [Flavobacterium sp. WLB]|uniref:hypothetical protein n=1 Tax=unclassified Flavobacterium TaxID=196869 RepID=UPI0006ABABA3|nr:MULTISPECIES: hypothetical protein [unclassified Flavobacterium]KOP37907.1 hypothetical protein AKO67_12500 [Flavobacterium sp. VMW]OWU90076.1 hypothetical protein APR43_13395 [Flavobacterium sp. NLM]PUU70903.1 hypothetical protein DBB36_06160 [Flavobacterium sp. WLB]